MRTGTYPRKPAADKALSLVEAQLITGDWTDPQRSKIKLQFYAEEWIEQRPNLRARTVELYQWLLAKHIDPVLGGVAIGKITPELVREWRATLQAVSAGPADGVLPAQRRGSRPRAWDRCAQAPATR